MIQYFKALHLIFVVTWFAGLFYIVRLFVYYAETKDKPEPARSILQQEFLGMQRRLWYGITTPSAVLVAIFGLGMPFYLGYPLTQWLIIKLVLVALLYLYHFSCQMIFDQQQKGIIRYSGYSLRIWNEVATLFLVGIVFLAVLKNYLDLLWALVGLLVLMIVLFTAIRIYKQLRNQPK
ncbi:MAG: protoporphyrinogen IX oxidase [Bacteroidetes bacterium]|nr:MAG: protoporphyrinogen IX oxidase [Bacteroidota bacterium]